MVFLFFSSSKFRKKKQERKEKSIQPAYPRASWLNQTIQKCRERKIELRNAVEFFTQPRSRRKIIDGVSPPRIRLGRRRLHSFSPKIVMESLARRENKIWLLGTGSPVIISFQPERIKTKRVKISSYQSP